jgi:hypothetical protein
VIGIFEDTDAKGRQRIKNALSIAAGAPIVPRSPTP